MTLAPFDPSQVGAHPSHALRKVTAEDGYVLTYRAWHPEAEPKGTIALFNGIMSHSGWFGPLVAPLLASGYALVGADRRGSGLNKEARGDAPSAKHIVQDALGILEDAAPAGQPLLLAGWCWGSILALNLLRPLGARTTALALLTPGLFPTQAVITAAAEGKRAHADAPEDAAVLPIPIADEMFTGGPCLQSFVQVDPLKLRATTPRFLTNTKKLGMGAHMALRKLSVPTLVVMAEHDEATDNAAVQQAIAKLDVASTTIPGAHGLQFDAPDALANAMIGFFDAVLD
ncbi:MAG: alpha/beta hydrolase [Nannocystaceae bacterium]|nr:lysophospholipase [bacterium]